MAKQNDNIGMGAAQALRRMPGFTLIELLVVIAIVGILAAVVTVNINLRNPAKLIGNEALRLGAQMQIASDSAIFARQQLGIRFHPGTWEFWILVPGEGDKPATWQIIEEDALAMREPSISMDIVVEIEGISIVLEPLEEELAAAEDSPDNPIKPHVMFLSNGEILPEYRIEITDSETSSYQRVVYMGEEEPIIVEQPEP